MKLSWFAPPAIGLLALAGTMSPASAAVPSNDTFGGASAISALPFDVTVDTTQATTDATDTQANAGCGAPATDASVWYQYTPATDGTLVADVSQSDYSAGVIVLSGTPGSFVLQSCGPGATEWQATAGTTYTILAFDDQTDGAGNGGTLHLNVDVAPPTPEVHVTVNPKASFTKTGDVLLRGTVACSAGASTELDANMTQKVGRLKINGYGTSFVDCGDGSTQAWTMEVTADNGLFRGGKAASVTFAYACGSFDCGTDYVEHVVMLSGKK